MSVELVWDEKNLRHVLLRDRLAQVEAERDELRGAINDIQAALASSRSDGDILEAIDIIVEGV